MKRDRNRRPCCLAAIALALGACSRLPSNFADLPLESKVEAYAAYVREHNGYPRDDARSLISVHGWAAADLMAEYLDGSKKGLPAVEALIIIDRVQLRGCSLKGTRSEAAIARFLKSEPVDSLAHTEAFYAMRAIKANSSAPRFDGFTGGPCPAVPETVLPPLTLPRHCASSPAGAATGSR
jgi:hypothetical protein